MAGNNRIAPMGIGAKDVTPLAGASMKSGFGQTEMTVHAETHALASAAREEALIKAKIAVALNRPRNWDVVAEKILTDCQRKEFAEAAIYSKPIGRGDDEEVLSGLSIRFIEAALQHATNVSIRSFVSSEDPYIRKVTVQVLDLESMVDYSDEISVEKTVITKKLWGKEEVIGERVNSKNERVYVVKATDDKLYNKEQALKSKAIRNAGSKLLPSWIKEQALAACNNTLKEEVSNDIGAYKRDLISKFESLGATSAQVQTYVGKTIEAMTQADVVELFKLGSAIKSGETTWAEAFERKIGKSPDEVTAPEIPTAQENVNQGTGEVASADEVEELLILIGEITQARDPDAAKAVIARVNKANLGNRRKEVGAAISAMNKALRETQ